MIGQICLLMLVVSSVTLNVLLATILLKIIGGGHKDNFRDVWANYKQQKLEEQEQRGGDSASSPILAKGRKIGFDQF